LFTRELVAASSKPLILSILSKKESYGYEIIKSVRELSNETIQWKDGMLYPVLHRLEKEDLIESFWKTSENGRKRRYYRIKNKGKVILEQEAENIPHDFGLYRCAIWRKFDQYHFKWDSLCEHIVLVQCIR